MTRTRSAAALLLMVAACAAWWPVLGSGLFRAAPIAAVAALLVARRLSAPLGALTIAVWFPLAMVLAGIPLHDLAPAHWDDLGTGLRGGLDLLRLPARTEIVGNPWPLATALFVAGSYWCVAGLVALRHGRVESAFAFVLLAMPLGTAIALRQTPAASWHGVAVLAAALLWLSRGRPLPAFAATAVIALIATIGAQAFGPRDRWLAFGSFQKPAFTELETRQLYGPLENRRTGATMFQITSKQPALWRMQVLETFNGRGFDVTRRAMRPYPEPAARTVTATVRVKGLRNRLVASPGRTTEVTSKSSHRPVNGEGVELTPGPEDGDTYTVTASVVQATKAELATVKIPAGNAYYRDTHFWTTPPPTPIARPAAALADDFPPGYEGTPLARVLTLARNLSRGTDSELEVVRRVQAYLLDPKRFTYSTDVESVTAQPLVDFLLTTHKGYCQHFAGAAALLLRLAGVPTRVVAGFATGHPSGVSAAGITYDVRDQDAHAWIEVYFPGYGWVPFNPTPAAADAAVAQATNVFDPGTVATSGSSDGVLPGVLIAAAIALGIAARIRRRQLGRGRRTEIGDLLARVARSSDDPSTTYSMLGQRLAEIGPAVTALAERAERNRFHPAGEPPMANPRRQVWRALRQDIGFWRAARKLLIAP